MNDVRELLQRSLRRLTIAVVALSVSLTGLGLTGWVSATHQRDELRRVTTSVNEALCTLRTDLEKRVAASRQFLLDHPKGVDGITPAVLKTSIASQQQTIDALGSLDC